MNNKLDSNKKIVFLGAANDIHTVRWVNALAKRGIEVHLIYCSDQVPTNDSIDSNVIQYKLKHRSPIGYYTNGFQLKKLLLKIKPMAVNAHYASGFGTLLRFTNFQPSILSVWGSDVYEFPYRSKFAMKTIEKNLNFPLAISSTSNIMAKQIENISKWNIHDINVIPFGVDLDLFKRVSSYKCSKSIKIGIAKKLKRNYGIHNIIKAIEIVIKKLEESSNNIEISLDIYGEGPEKEKLQGLINELQLNEIINLRGYIPNDELPKVMEEFDICVLASERESFGVSAIESLAMNIPLIATDAEGFLEVLEDGKYGLIVPKNNINSISNAILSLINDYERRLELSKKGREHVKLKYDWNKNVDDMISLYYNTARIYSSKELL